LYSPSVVTLMQTFIDHAKGRTIREAAATFQMHMGLVFCGSLDTVAANAWTVPRRRPDEESLAVGKIGSEPADAGRF
jgi:hypothetical protein